MSIFSAIKDAIFGADKGSTPAPAAPARPVAPAATAPAQPTIPASPAAAQWESRPRVDIEAVLSQLAAKSPQKLNWRTSIVDLMKLVGIDSSFANRKELARELGYVGDPNNSADMNIWLHKQVMIELERNGGKVPASLVA